MNDLQKRGIDDLWGCIFEEYSILSKINDFGSVRISAAQIRRFKEPRLMAKFDHKVDLPEIFSSNELSILPVARGDYIISNFDAYHVFEGDSTPIINLPLPEHIQSLDENNIFSEAVALNCAFATGIIKDFLDDEDLIPTVSGRMSSGLFKFYIDKLRGGDPAELSVNNAQIEIDAAYEGVAGLALFEAKRDISDDFLVRQLYYPFRTWHERVSKPVRPIFLVYSNGIYRLYEYKFDSPTNYNSLTLLRQKKYSLEDTSMEITEIQEVLNKVGIIAEPQVPFPQADNFDRVINICELLKDQEMNRFEVTEQYAFDVRQTSYYTDAARYLGLLEKRTDVPSSRYALTENGRRLLLLNYKQRQLRFGELILSHKVFHDVFSEHLTSGEMPSKERIIEIMRRSNLFGITSDSTFERRSSTVKSWINWILALVNK